MTDTNAKQQALVKTLSDSMFARMEPLFNAITAQQGTEFANIHTLLAAMVARIEAMESGAATGGAKRAPRGERKTGGSTASATDNKDPLDKVKNAMLWTRHMWSDPSFREKHMTDEVRALMDEDAKINIHEEGSAKRYATEGHFYWTKCATAQQKNDLRAEYNRWKDERTRSALAEPLKADNGADDGEENA